MKQSARDNLFVLYCHTNKKNGKKYFGITSRDPQKRWGARGQGYRSNKHFWLAIQKYGWDAFDHDIILEGLTVEDACVAEKNFIKMFNTINPEFGYNHTSGGEEGHSFSEDSRKKMSDSAKNRVYTDEWKQHLSESGRGKTPWNKGKHLSEKHKEKLKIRSSGRKHTDSEIKRIRENSGNNIPVEIDGVVYQSISMCAEILGDKSLSKKIQAWLSGENSMPWEYKERGLTYSDVPHEYVEAVSHVEDKFVVCDGIEFPSMAACERYYGLPRLSVGKWLNGVRKMPKDFVDKGLMFSTKKRYWYVVL